MSLISLQKFFASNRKLSHRFTPDHVHEANVFGAYLKIGAIVLSHPKVARVVDVGAGKAWQFPAYYKHWYEVSLIGIDIDYDGIVGNAALDQRIVCDVVDSIPIADECVDVIMVHSGIEHFENNERFLRNAFRILRPGGFLLAQFPGRYAPFAIANRVLPDWLAKKALRTSMGATDVLGFKAYYDRTDYKSFKRLSANAGFEEVYYLPGFFSSSYFAFFTPLYLLSYLYDMIVYALGIRQVASYNLFLLRSPSVDSEPLRLYPWK